MNALRERILKWVTVVDSGCWEWTGARQLSGLPYGRLSIHGRARLAHRAAWAAWVGEIPPRTMVLHRCDNPPCCNPDHLFLGNQSENMKDAFAKGRIRRAGEYHPAHKLKASDVVAIRARRRSGETYPSIAAAFGISASQARAVASGQCWKEVAA